MEHLFFNYDGTLADVAKRIFAALGLSGYLEGDSLNVLGGTYISIAILGIEIRLEKNSYDYEDKYHYMLAVQKDPCSDLLVSDPSVGSLARVVVRVLADNASIPVALETEGGLEEFVPVGCKNVIHTSTGGLKLTALKPYEHTVETRK